jgi:hypothetical protein
MPVDTHWRGHEPESEETDASDTDSDHEVTAPSVSEPGWVQWIEQQAVAQRTAVAGRIGVREPVRDQADPGRPPDPVQGTEQVEAPVVVLPETAPVRRATPATDLDRRPGRLVVAGIATALVLASLLALGAWKLVAGGGGGDVGADRPRPTSTPPDVRTTSPSEDTPTTPPAPPFALPADAQHSTIRVLTGGALEVQQWVHLSTGETQLRLGVPDDVEVSGLQVLAGGGPVMAPATPAGTTVLDFSPTQDLYLSYRLTGVLKRNGDRALARATSVQLGVPEALSDWTVEFESASILSLACTTTDDPVPQACGAEAGTRGWRVVPPADASGLQVMAQIELDAPS